ncbi:MAG: SusC/RagA family TonB-linked outer membrane protein [Chitinophagaceae bacterium]|nr:SusC/RagA family TonB-linked outer membrane protein [Chitinophagaceae bacterium]
MSISSLSSIGQTRQVTGVVHDATNSTALEGATVILKKSKTTVLSDKNGNFVITVPASSVELTITFAGYQAKTIRVSETETSIIVNMSPSEKSQMEDVVIVGVQRQFRRNTTSSISTVVSKDIENLPSPSVDQLMQGRVAGMNVQIGTGEPGVAPTVVIRGNSRVSTAIGDDPTVSQARALSGPLYVIDGIPVNSDDINNSLGATGTNFLAGININDIESVDVQKDAAATAAWGSRGANGVVYIKTKRGRSLKPEFRVNVYGGLINEPPLLKTATGAAERQQKMDIINQYATYSNLAAVPQLLTDMYNPSYNNATNWQGLFYRQSSIKNVDASINAATDILNYRVSLNYYDEKGIIEGFGLKRYSMRNSFDFKISPKFNTQLVIGLSKSDRQRGRKFDDNSSDNTPYSGYSQPTSFYRLMAFDSLNFQGLYDKLRNKNIDDYYLASLSTNYDILPSLRYSMQASAYITATNRDFFQPSNIDEVAALDPDAAAQPSFGLSRKGTYSQYFFANTLNYLKRLGAGQNSHGLALTASQQFSSDVVNSNYILGSKIPSNDIQVIQGVAPENVSAWSDYKAAAILSLLGQLQYDYNNKYIAYVSYRGDASSRFGANNKWGYFPAAGLGWIVSDEKFMDRFNSFVSLFKIRGSYGVSGDNSLNFYAPYNSYVISGTYNGSTAIQPDYNNGLTKNNLTWSKVIQKNVGFDLQMFKSRINLTVDVYDKLAKDGFFDFSLPFYTGFSSINFNAKSLWVNNRGVDITLNTRNLAPTSKVQWNMNLVLSFNKNVIAKLPNNNRTFVKNDWNGVDRIYSVGQPIYEMFQMKYEGVYNNTDEIPFNPLTGNSLTYFKGNHKVVPGDPKWLDVNKSGDVWSDEDNGAAYGDRIPTGDPNPKLTGGWVNEFTYKNFSISILSIFTWKRTVVNTYMQQQISNIVGGYSSSIYTFAAGRVPDLSGINYWTPEKAKDPGYKADFPSINPFGPSYYQYIPFTSMFNEDGSYFKIKNIILNYTIPRKTLTSLKLKGLRVYGIVDNILTLKKSSMPNPELVDQLGVYTGGLYPTPTKITFGVDVQF